MFFPPICKQKTCTVLNDAFSLNILSRAFPTQCVTAEVILQGLLRRAAVPGVSDKVQSMCSCL